MRTPCRRWPEPIRGRWRAPALAGVLCLARLAAAAAPLGGEFQVNTYTPDDQSNPAVATDAAGGFVVVWQSAGQDGSFAGVFGQRFASTGARLGSEFRINTFTTGSQGVPTVASDTTGNFVVLWQSPVRDGSANGIIGQRYASSGNPLGSEFLVNTYTTNDQLDPAVAIDPTGAFVAVWESAGQDGSDAGVFARRYASTGEALGTEFQVNTHTTGNQFDAAVAVAPSGDFVVVWESDGQDGSRFGIFAQRFGSSGTPLGTEFQVNSYTTGLQLFPTVAAESEGDFVVVWQSSTQDGHSDGVFAQRFTSTAAALGSEFQVNTYTTNLQGPPVVATDAADGFIVLWRSATQDGDGDGVFGQRYDRTGATVGGEFAVNIHTVGNQDSPAVAAALSGQFVVAWTSAGQDGSGSSIFARRFGDVAVTPTATPTATPREPTPTLTSIGCAGDCDGNRRVAINELVIGVNIALGNLPASNCPALDQNDNDRVEINELIAAVGSSLNGCAE